MVHARTSGHQYLSARGITNHACITIADVTCDAWAFCPDQLLQRFIIKDFDEEDTLHIALGCRTMVGVDRQQSQAAGVWWYSGLPSGLRTFLCKHKKKPIRSGIKCIALDASDPDNYFVEVADGSARWEGPESLSNALNENGALRVEAMCFAPRNGWYVRWEDGSQEWEGLPVGLHNKLLGRARSRARVQAISCGPSGEWFVRFRDGEWCANGLPDEMDRMIDSLQEDDNEVVAVDFGSEGSWLLVNEA